MAMLGERADPYRAYNFRIRVDGLEVGGFQEVSGLQSEIEVYEYQEGGLNTYVHRLPGPARYPSNLILKRGLTDQQELWVWYQSIIFRRGPILRRNGSIILLNDAGEEARGWNFFQAYPVRWLGPQFNAQNQTVAFESLELVHNGLLAQPG